MGHASLLRSLPRRVFEYTLRVLGPRGRRILAWRTLWESGFRCVTFERDGVVWSLAPDCDFHIGFGLFVEGGWHAREIAALVEWMTHHRLMENGRDVVVDVGANVGSTCIPLVRATGCRALAIEPVERSFRALKINLDLNGLGERIRVVNKAVLRRAGHVRICVRPGLTGGSFVLRGTSNGPASDFATTCEEVEADTLSALIDSAGIGAKEVPLVWADVEGCEADVIESGANLWEQGVPLWAELSPDAQAKQQNSHAFTALAAAHFDRFIPSTELVRLGAGVKPVPTRELAPFVGAIPPDSQTDVLFLPPRFPAESVSRQAGTG